MDKELTQEQMEEDTLENGKMINSTDEELLIILTEESKKVSGSTVD
jgi:hypothetical protein